MRMERDVGAGRPPLAFTKAEVEGSIPARFEKVVAHYPHRVAVKDGELILNYDALNRAANRMARALVELCGHGSEPVALLLRHGLPVIGGLLGVLKCAKAYTALDPSHPFARLTHVLGDLQPAVILTQGEFLPLAHRLADQVRCQVVNADEVDTDLCSANLSVGVPADSLAAVFYTSGSTGAPKGVERDHRSFLHRIWHETRDYQTTAEDRCALLATVSFGASVSDIFGALLNGASLHPFEVMEAGLDQLASWLKSEEITFAQPPITLLRHLLDTLPPGAFFPTLRHVGLPGQALYKSDLERIRRCLPNDSVVVHRMGLSEAQVIARLVIHRDTPIAASVVPVGYAAPDMELQILDDEGNSLGPNEVGEIAVRSSYLARGYWRKPDLTRSRFLPDPEGGDKRVYLTGDLGRIRPDGCLEHMGRKDFQVKVRGYRIEISEVEAALSNLGLVGDAVVAVKETPSGNRRLVAYVVPADGAEMSTSRVRSALAKVLPDYMIPTAYVAMDRLPLTPNGKFDRQALPEPSDVRPGLDCAFVAPGTTMETRLAQIWSEVLKVQPVGIRDPFFELGGQSLLAARIVSRIRAEMGVELSLKRFFSAPTVAVLAEELERAQAKADAEGKVIAESDLTRALRLLETF